MPVILRASVSLDGKLLSAAGQPGRYRISEVSVRDAGELLLTIHPLIVGGDFPSLWNSSEGFLTNDLCWELLSITREKQGTIKARYGRKDVKVGRASRRSPAGV